MSGLHLRPPPPSLPPYSPPPQFSPQATNAFIKTFFGSSLDIPVLFVTDFPKPDTGLSLDFASVLGPLFYMWVLQLLFPVSATD